MRAERGSTALALFYLAATIVGTVVPYLIILPWFAANGPAFGAFFGLPFVNRPAAMFSADVLISVAVFLVWAEVEARRLGMGARWQPILCICAAGLCCALPLFLARREWALAR